jgi:hypothetical protein
MAPSDASFDITNEGDVGARPDTVWAWLTRADLWSTYFPRAKNVHVERGGPTLAVGSVVVWEMLGSTIRVTVTRADPPNVLAWEGGAKGVHAYHAWLIEPRGDHGERSHVVTVETERGFLPSVAGFAFKGSLRSAHTEWIAGLAHAASGEHLPTPLGTPVAPSVAPTPAKASLDDPVDDGPPPEGPTTRLVLAIASRPGPPKLDGPAGNTTLTIQSKSTGAPLVSLKWNGDWALEAYAPARKAYVLSLRGVVGASRAVAAIRYLEESGAVRESKVNALGWFAYALVPSPDGRALAFVGRRDGASAMGLELLDLSTDDLVELGPAPGPPPHDWQGCDENGYGWGAGPGDGYERMDRGIIEFVGGELRASFGDDTCHARAKTRTTHAWPVGAAAVPSVTK